MMKIKSSKCNHTNAEEVTVYLSTEAQSMAQMIQLLEHAKLIQSVRLFDTAHNMDLVTFAMI